MSTAARCYTTEVVLEKLGNMPLSTFVQLKRKGKLPFLQELKPRLGRRIRYRADLVDRWLEGRWTAPRAFQRAAF